MQDEPSNRTHAHTHTHTDAILGLHTQHTQTPYSWFTHTTRTDAIFLVYSIHEQWPQVRAVPFLGPNQTTMQWAVISVKMLVRAKVGVYCVLCTVYCVLCNVYCVHSVLCTVYCVIFLWSVHLRHSVCNKCSAEPVIDLSSTWRLFEPLFCNEFDRCLQISPAFCVLCVLCVPVW